LIKLQISPATQPRAGWQRTISEQRVQLERVLEDSPSLRQFIPEAIEKELPTARRMALLDLAEIAEQPSADPTTLTFTADQILGNPSPPLGRRGQGEVGN
jgi:hypothetical protein